MTVFPDIPRPPLPCLFPLLSSAAEARERSLILTPGKQTKGSPHKFISWSGRQFTQSKSPAHCCQMNGAGSRSPRRLPRERPLIMLPLWELSTRDTLSAEAGPGPGALSSRAPGAAGPRSSGPPGAAGSELAPRSQWRPRPRRGGRECCAVSLPSSENCCSTSPFWILYLLKSSLSRNAPEF